MTPKKEFSADVHNQSFDMKDIEQNLKKEILDDSSYASDTNHESNQEYAANTLLEEINSESCGEEPSDFELL